MRAVLAAALVAAAAGPALAQPGTVDFTISGTSTIRGWSCSAKGAVAVTPGAPGAAAPGFPSGVQAATLTVLHKDITCANDEMTEHMHQAMKSDTFKEIVFRLEKYAPSGASVDVSGSMTILGVTKPVTVPLTLTPGAAGVEVEGATSLDMTAYGVEPPVVMLGMLRVRPQIRIEFRGVVPGQ
jgi:hypothetical protein